MSRFKTIRFISGTTGCINCLQWVAVFLLGIIPFFQTVSAQDAVVSSYFNAADPRDEWTEILVIQDNLDMRNWKFRDNSSDQDNWSTEISFNNITFWSHMRAGTIIIIWHRQYPSNSTTVKHTLDINPADGYLELHANDPAYFSGGNFGPSPNFNGATLNIAGNGDILQLRNSASTSNHVHALAHKTTVGIDFTNLPPPKLDHTQSLASNEAVFVCPGNTILEYGTPPQIGTTYTAKALDPATTFGLPNTCATGILTNSDFWRTTRQPGWTTPTLTATPNGTYSQVDLSWNLSNSPNIDGTEGYIILRNTTNIYTAPSDGTSYAAFSTIGSATVVANIPSSTTVYSDIYPLSCGENVFYRIYAYRYNDDNLKGNNYDLARGRAYNEINHASATATGPAAPAPPTSASVNPVTLCENDPGNITLTAAGGSGSTLEWLTGSCTGLTIGVGNGLSIPSPTVTTTYYVRWTSPGCTPSSCVDVTLNVTPAPTTADAGPDQSKCGVLTTNLAAIDPSTGTGTWSFVSGPPGSSFGNQSLYNTSFTAIVTGTYILRWTTSNGAICSESSDEVSIEFSNNVTVIAGSNSPVCTGDTLFLTSSIEGATYSWSHPSNGFTSTLQNPKIPNSTALNSGTYTVVVTNVPNGCPGSTNSTTIIVNNRPNTPQINNIATGVQDVCIGSIYPYTIDPPSAGSVYAWSLTGGGFITNTANSNLINVTWTTPGNYVLSVTETSSNSCTGNQVILNITVNSVSVAGVSISASSNPVCTGTLVTIEAIPQNPGTSPDYIWYKNSIQAGAPNLPTYSFIPDDGDQVYVELISSSPCALPNPAPSQVITMSVNTSLIPSITISASINPACSGSMVDFTSTISDGGSNPAYEWKKNGSPVGTNSPTYSDNTLVTNDLITCTLTPIESCASPPQDTSNEIKMTVNPIANPTISVSANIDPSCAGNLVTITATSRNGGNMPLYQWVKNGIAVGGNSPVYSDNSFANNDIVNCTLTSNASCISTATVQSSPVTLTVNPVPSVTDTSSSNPSVCGGIDGSISIGSLMASTMYQIDYYFNGSLVSISKLSDPAGVLIIDGLSAGNFSNVTITLNGCPSVPFNVNLSDPGAAIAPNILSDTYLICSGESVTLSATGCSGEITWKNGETGTVLVVSPTVTTTYYATCKFNGCISLPSIPVEIKVKSPPQITNTIATQPSSWCIDDGIITLYGLIPDSVYTLYYTLNGMAFAGSQLSTSGMLEITGCEPATYFHIVAELSGCRSDSIDVIVGNPTSPQAPMVTASDDTICSGQIVVLTANGCNGEVTWNDGSKGNTRSLSLLSNSDFYATCTESSCTSAPGNTVTIVIVPADFTGISGKQNVCTNGQISLNATGNANLYEWTTPKGVKTVNQSFSMTGVAISDSGYYQLVSTNIVGCTDSDSVRVTVNDPPEIKITSDKDFCAGTQQNLQAGEGFSNYLWNDGSILSILPVRDEARYWVMVTDTNGCVVSDTSAINSCIEEIIIPNAFSPNQDGYNDFFRPVTGSNVLLDYSIIIYNRWGQMVYKSNDYLSGWDGTEKGKYVLSGLYTYVISYKLVDQSKPDGFSKSLLRGTVMMVR